MTRSAAAAPTSARGVGPLLCGWSVWGASVTLGVTDGTRLLAGRLLLEEWIASVDNACNRFAADSDLSRCNRSAGAWVAVGPIFLDTLEVALEAAAVSQGAVDPTVGSSLVELGYDRDFDLLVGRPDRALTTNAPRRGTATAPVAGWRTVEVDRINGRVRIPAGTQLDLGATAKAWCVDRSVEAIARLGVGVLVSIGGDLAVAGPVPTGGWRVTVQESSRVGLDETAPVVAVSEGAIATSGTSVRTWMHEGRLVHHIIDPRTGQPARPIWRLVTVAAPTCVEANTSATATVVRGVAGLGDLAADRRAARLVDRAGRVIVVGGWPEDEAHVGQGAESRRRALTGARS